VASTKRISASIDAPKKTIRVLIDIFLKEGIITRQTFFLHIIPIVIQNALKAILYTTMVKAETLLKWL
jgi:hypothetical protein